MSAPASWLAPARPRATFQPPTITGVVEVSNTSWKPPLAMSPEALHRLLFLAVEGTNELHWLQPEGLDPDVDYLKKSTGYQTEQLLAALGIQWNSWTTQLTDSPERTEA